MKTLQRGGVHAVSGTPGRLKDVMEKGALRTKSVRVLVIDEADEMLGEGFKEQVYHVYRFLPAEAQVVLVSATLPAEVLRMTDQFMTDPVRVLVRRDELTLEVRGVSLASASPAVPLRSRPPPPATSPNPPPENHPKHPRKKHPKHHNTQGIKQFFVAVEKEEWKFDTLCDLYDTLAVTQAVIFVNSRKKVDWLSNKMRERNFAVSAMHGEMPQRERDAIMNEFRTGASRVLITTDS